MVTDNELKKIIMEEPKKEDYDFNDVYELAAYTRKLHKFSEAQQKEIKELKEENKALQGVIEGMQTIIAKLEEDNRILRQYQRIAIHDKEHRKKILQDYMRVNQQLTDKIVELNG